MKKKFLVILTMVVGLVLSFDRAWGQACTISTVAGNGDDMLDLGPSTDWSAEVATDVRLRELHQINIDSSGNAVFTVRGAINNLIRITPSGGLEGIMSPSGDYPIGCEDFSFATNGDLYCLMSHRGDFIGGIIRYPADGGPQELFNEDELGAFSLGGLAVDASQNLYFTSGVHTIDPGTGYVSRAAGQIKKRSPDGTISIIADGWENGFNGSGVREAVCESINPSLPMTVDRLGNVYFKACDYSNWESVGWGDSPSIKKIATNGVITTFVEDAGSIGGMAMYNDGSIVAAIGQTVHRLWFNGNAGIVSGSGRGFSGDGGPARDAQLNDPRDVAVDSNGNIYIADNGNNRIRKVTCPVVADLRLHQAAASSRRAGRPFSLNFTINNDGPGAATDVTLREDLPLGWSYVSHRGSGGPVTCSAGGSSVACSFSGTIESGQRRSVTINVRALRSGTFENRADISSAIDDPNVANNQLRQRIAVSR